MEEPRDSSTYVIEEARFDSDLRRAGQLFAQCIPDVRENVTGTLRARARVGPAWLLLLARDQRRQIVGAVSSHAPYALAEAAGALVAPAAAASLLTQTRLLEHLAVAPEHRRRSLARRLLQEAATRHRAEPEVRLWFGFLDEREVDQAADVYRATGFRLVSSAGDLPAPANVLRHALNRRQGQWFWQEL